MRNNVTAWWTREWLFSRGFDMAACSVNTLRAAIINYASAFFLIHSLFRDTKRCCEGSIKREKGGVWSAPLIVEMYDKLTALTVIKWTSIQKEPETNP